MREFIHTVINLMIEFHERKPKTIEQVYRHIGDLGKMDQQMQMRRETIALVAEIFRKRRHELHRPRHGQGRRHFHSCHHRGFDGAVCRSRIQIQRLRNARRIGGIR